MASSHGGDQPYDKEEDEDVPEPVMAYIAQRGSTAAPPSAAPPPSYDMAATGSAYGYAPQQPMPYAPEPAKAAPLPYPAYSASQVDPGMAGTPTAAYYYSPTTPATNGPAGRGSITPATAQPPSGDVALRIDPVAPAYEAVAVQAPQQPWHEDTVSRHGPLAWGSDRRTPPRPSLPAPKANLRAPAPRDGTRWGHTRRRQPLCAKST